MLFTVKSLWRSFFSYDSLNLGSYDKSYSARCFINSPGLSLKSFKVLEYSGKALYMVFKFSIFFFKDYVLFSLTNSYRDLEEFYNVSMLLKYSFPVVLYKS